MKRKAKIGDIIFYYNTKVNELYFHKILELQENAYYVQCLNGGRVKFGTFDHYLDHKIIDSKLIRLLFL